MYDSLYRLIQAKGREHLANNTAPDAYDAARTNLPHKGDGNQLQQYTQRYKYDKAGNMLLMHNVNSWSRSFEYSLLNNQLLSAPAKNDTGTPFSYKYDVHGNMINMQHLPAMDWNFKDELQHIGITASTDNDFAVQAYYVYDAAGQRIRKVVEKGNIREERIYLAGFEIFRKRRNGVMELERETLHIMDDTRRIALVETKIKLNHTAEPPLIRYQYTNHLGTAALEMDGTTQALIISYEEYYPFGSTSYQATDQMREVPVKRYRYTGKERDEESGLEYHEARYYAGWLGRWISTDPSKISNGVNMYLYVNNRPVNQFDINGKWGTDMHFLAVYWAGRMQGANHAQAIIAAIGSQSLDDTQKDPNPFHDKSRKKDAPSLKASFRESDRQLGNNSHALNLNKQESEAVALKGIQEKNGLLFGLGLHTVGDYLPHANLSGERTWGHQEGYNEDFSLSTGMMPDADFTNKNPMKALATFEHFRELWSKYTGTQFNKLSGNDPNAKLLADFIFTPDDDAAGKEKTVTAGLKALGVTDAEMNDVLKFYRNPAERVKAIAEMKNTLKGSEAIAIANQIWLNLKNNSSLFNSQVLINLKTELDGLLRITTAEFEKRRESNYESVIIQKKGSVDKKNVFTSIVFL